MSLSQCVLYPIVSGVQVSNVSGFQEWLPRTVSKLVAKNGFCPKIAFIQGCFPLRNDFHPRMVSNIPKMYPTYVPNSQRVLRLIVLESVCPMSYCVWSPSFQSVWFPRMVSKNSFQIDFQACFPRMVSRAVLSGVQRCPSSGGQL